MQKNKKFKWAPYVAEIRHGFMKLIIHTDAYEAYIIWFQSPILMQSQH
jgi:hypothetical protein